MDWSIIALSIAVVMLQCSWFASSSVQPQNVDLKKVIQKAQVTLNRSGRGYVFNPKYLYESGDPYNPYDHFDSDEPDEPFIKHGRRNTYDPRFPPPPDYPDLPDKPPIKYERRNTFDPQYPDNPDYPDLPDKPLIRRESSNTVVTAYHDPDNPYEHIDPDYPIGPIGPDYPRKRYVRRNGHDSENPNKPIDPYIPIDPNGPHNPPNRYVRSNGHDPENPSKPIDPYIPIDPNGPHNPPNRYVRRIDYDRDNPDNPIDPYIPMDPNRAHYPPIRYVRSNAPNNTGNPDDIPLECRHKQYCTIKPPTYPQEKFNNLFKSKAPLKTPSLIVNYKNITKNTHLTDGPDVLDPCDSFVEFMPLYKIRSKGGKWRTVIQAPDMNYIQTVRLETCTHEGLACFPVIPRLSSITTACKQEYSTWEIVVEVDDGSGATEAMLVDLPTCCSCHYKDTEDKLIDKNH